MDSYYSMFRTVQDKLGIKPVDGTVITILAYILSPPETKLRNAIIIGGAHGLLHYETCIIQTQDGLIKLFFISFSTNGSTTSIIFFSVSFIIKLTTATASCSNTLILLFIY